MERITYRKTLDVHKNGIQFMLQGFETADKLSRVIEISLMASGDAIDFPLERMIALMYVTTPSAESPSINSCTIKDNKVVYEVLPITEEGITTMQLKLIESFPNGATSVLASPKFVVEVTKSNADDEEAEQTTTFTALEDAVAKAKVVYDERFLRMELASDCMFYAYYADGSVYETDILKKLFHVGSPILAESFAKGGTGVRSGEDTDNAKYYSTISKSESLNAQNLMESSKEILEEVQLHGVYTAFSVDFETGKLEYVSPSFKFKVNEETGKLEAEGQTYTFDAEVSRVVSDWLKSNGVALDELGKVAVDHEERITENRVDIDLLKGRVTPIEAGGTGATTKEEALINLGVTEYQKPWNVEGHLAYISPSEYYFCRTSNHGTTHPEEYEGTYVEKVSEEIYMKNSGQIYLDIGLSTNNEAYFKLDTCEIRVNGEAVKHYSHSDFEGERTAEITDKILLNVNKGDVITGYLRSYVIEADNSRGGHALGINGIIANAETPYIYTKLFEGSEEITVSEILNALTGGAE